MAEPRDISLRGVAVGAAIILTGIFAALAAAWALVAVLGAPASGPNATHAPHPAGPRLQNDPHRDLARYLAEQHRRLESYGWVDRASGRVHIPIERAMRLRAGETK